MYVNIKKTVIIINPFVYASYILKRFQSLDYAVVFAIAPGNYDMELIMKRIPKEDVDYLVLLEGNLEVDISLLNNRINHHQLKVSLILSGHESTYLYTENLCHHLFKEISNVPIYADYRCNKYVSNQMLFQANIPVPKQWLIKSCNDLNLIHSNEYPIVLKHYIGGAGTDGVYICENKKIAQENFESKVQINEIFGSKYSDEMIAEEFLQGQEYVIDTSSYCGTHHIVAIIGCIKQQIGVVQRHHQKFYIKRNSHLYPIIASYALDILDKVKMQTGFCYIEVILTQNNKPKLVEINPRVSGSKGYINLLTYCNRNEDQVTILDKLSKGIRPRHKENNIYSRLYYFQNNGFAYSSIKTELLDEIKSIKEYSILIGHSKSGVVSLTLNQTVILILLISNRESTLENDIEKLKILEENGELYEKDKEFA